MKLSDTQRIVLSHGAQHPQLLAIAPKHLPVEEFGEEVRTQLIITERVSDTMVCGRQHKISSSAGISDEFLAVAKAFGNQERQALHVV